MTLRKHQPNSEQDLCAQLTMADLPPPDTRRWVARRKAEVAAAVQTGLLTVEDACRRYRLTREELSGWQRGLHQFGVRGLQATRGLTRPNDSSWNRRHA
jgi:hypothetical protein